MGLFSSNLAITYPAADTIRVPDWVRDGLVDPGDLLLELYTGTKHSVIDQVHEELDRVRRPQGGYDLSGVKHDKRSGPLFLLSWITAGDYIAVEVWAQGVGTLRGAQKQEMRSRVSAVITQHGIPAAATWTLMAWSSADSRAPSIEILNDLLLSGYRDWQSKITNGMVIDSFRKWRR